MATTTAASTGSGSTFNDARANLRLTPEKYTTLNELLDHNKPEVMEELVQTFGEQGITGFLRLTGAINSGGSADQIEYFEEGRRHRIVTGVTDGLDDDLQNLSVTADDGGSPAGKGTALGPNDVIMDSATGRRYVVTNADGSPTGADDYKLCTIKERSSLHTS